MFDHVHPESILGRLKSVPDPRSRRGRMYPLLPILGMLLLGALEGESSLRGMWLRGRKYWSELIQRLGVKGLPEPPALTTVWYVLQKVDARRLGEAWADGMGAEGEAIALDGKHLRGSRRKGEEALQVLTLVGHHGRQVLAQRIIEGGDETAAAVALLCEVPLQGRMVTLDAGLMERPVVKTVVKKGAATSDC